MARWILAVLILAMASQVAFGVSDPRPDVLGVYFDELGDQICKDALTIGAPFSLWIVYTNPTPASILGFEAGYYFSGSHLELGAQWPCGIIWVVEPDLDNLYVACAEPFPTTVATPLVRFDYLYLGAGSVDATFHVEKASRSALPGINPNIILADGSLMEVQQGQTAYTTLDCTVPVTDVGWGTIKSLYR